MSRPLRRSYFDLLKEKYPEPDAPRAALPAVEAPAPIRAATAADRRGGPAAASRRGRRLLAVVLGLLAASLLVLFLGPLLRPLEGRGGELPPPGAGPRASEVPRNVASRTVAPPAIAAPIAEIPAVSEAPPPTSRPDPSPLRRAEPRTVPQPMVATPPPPVRRTAEPATVETATAEPDTATGVKVFAPQPEYPAAARRAGVEGSVWVEAGVDGSGRVNDVRVVEGSSPELDRAAVEALRRWRFAPALRGGEPLAYRYRQQFRFALSAADRAAAALPPALLGAEVTPPVKLVTPLPGYTPAAWAAGIEGEVTLKATIDERGEVTAVEVLSGLPHGLTEAAVAAVRQWKFRPARRGGEPVAAEHRVSLRFAL